MPFSNPDDKNRAAREWYARNRALVIARVAHRKRTMYAGECVNCGGPTVGQSPKEIPEFCGKPACRSAQRKGKPIVQTKSAIKQALQ